MAKLIVKPAINFLSTVSDSDLNGQVSTIIYQMTGNLNFPNPSPTLAVVGATSEAFGQAIRDAANGGKLNTAIKNERRAELSTLTRQLANYVGNVCKGDLVKLLGSGFPIHKPTRHDIGPLPEPDTPTLARGAHSGTLIARVRRPYGTKICNWVVSLADSPDTPVQTAQTTGGRAEFRGLLPGQIYTVKVNVVGAAGASNWSGPARLMVV